VTGGVGGIEISIGKLAVYTAAAGIHPRRVIRVVLDMGTDNQVLLTDEMYLGNRHPRVRGERYDQLIDAYVTAAGTLFPHAMLHWEDFGARQRPTRAHQIRRLLRQLQRRPARHRRRGARRRLLRADGVGNPDARPTDRHHGAGTATRPYAATCNPFGPA